MDNRTPVQKAPWYGEEKDYDKKEPGQQFEEIQKAQRIARQARGIIDSIEKSKQRDEQELDQLGNEALDDLRQRKLRQNQPPEE